MLVKKVQPKELPENIISRLSFFYKVRLGEFVVITDREIETLYVNNSVPQKDIEGFLKVIMFPNNYVCDTEAGEGQFLNYVHEKYGRCTWEILIDAFKWHTDKKKRRRAKETAKEIMPFIRKELESKAPIVKYDERLLYEIQSAGLELNRRTPENIVGYGSVCGFYLGYLMGAGILQDNFDKTIYRGRRSI